MKEQLVTLKLCLVEGGFQLSVQDNEDPEQFHTLEMSREEAIEVAAFIIDNASRRVNTIPQSKLN